MDRSWHLQLIRNVSLRNIVDANFNCGAFRVGRWERNSLGGFGCATADIVGEKFKLFHFKSCIETLHCEKSALRNVVNQ